MIATVRLSPSPLPALLRELFPQEVAVALADPRAPAPPPLPEEQQSLARAVPTRRAEFAAGRAATRAAMAELRMAPAPVPAGADRAPVWPEGLTGSLSHTGTLCVAALGRSARFRAIGVDLEPAEDLEADLVPHICTAPEQAWLARRPAPQRGLLARLLFSAKECAYKCQYPLTHSVLEFDALEIRPDLSMGRFEARFTRAVGPFARGAILGGRFVIDAGLIGCGMALRQ